METETKTVGQSIKLTGLPGDPIAGLCRVLERAEKAEITGIHEKVNGKKLYDLQIKYLRDIDESKYLRLYNVDFDLISECVDIVHNKAKSSCDVFFEFSENLMINGKRVFPEISGNCFHWRVYPNNDQSGMWEYEFGIMRNAIVFTYNKSEMLSAFNEKFSDFIDDFKSYRSKPKYPGLFQGAFNAYTHPDKPKDSNDSDIVLIDLKGNRDQEDFTLGFYDYEESKWVDSETSDYIENTDLLRWMPLPLAKYDK